MTQHLKGKHVVVFGASGGIGHAVAWAYADEGVSAITITYNSKKEEAEKLAKELRRKGVKVYVTHADRSTPEAVQQMLEAAVKANKQEIDIVADNIGISPDTPFGKQTRELWERVLGVNLIDCWISSREAGNRMKAKGVKGHIVIVTSINGRITQGPYSAPYNASKAGQESLVRDLQIEFAKAKIHVNGVAPGWVDTAMNVSVPKKEMKRELQKILAERQATPEDVANTIIFLSGKSSDYHHGEIFDIKGGYNLA